MKSSGVIALVAAGVVVGGGAATYQLTRPASGSVQVNYVNPASEPTTSTPTTVATTSAPSPTSTTTTKTAVAVTSSSTTHKATVRKEATVANDPAPATTTSAPQQSGVKPPPKAPPRPPGETPGATGAFGPGQSNG